MLNAAMANSSFVTCPDLFGLRIELGESSLAEYFLKLDDEGRIDINNPKHREVFLYIFLLVEQVTDKIAEIDPRFRLKLCTTCGSAFDGTKVGDPDEFDFLLVMESLSEADSNLQWQRKSKTNVEEYNLQARDFKQWTDMVDNTKDRNVIVPSLLHSRFSTLVDDAMEKVVLPKFLKHGGFAAPHFSGVRSHRFAHLIQLFWDPTDSLSEQFDLMNLSGHKTSFVITIDLTLVLSAPKTLVKHVLDMVESSNLLGQYYQTLMYRLSQNGTVEDLNDFGVHMIPSSNQGWVLTTAALDYAIMEMFPSNSYLKRCIRVCKMIRDKFLTLGEKVISSSEVMRGTSEREKFKSQVKFLYDHRLIDTASAEKNPYMCLRSFCQGQSSAVHPSIFQQLNEYTNPICSASSGFIKYLSMLEVCFRLTDVEFSDSDTVDVDLVMTVLDKMSLQANSQPLGIPHIILKRNIIWPVSMHGYFNTRSLIADGMNTSWFDQHAKLMRILKDAYS